jgi:outer membrane biosynthesis protein TonB
MFPPQTNDFQKPIKFVRTSEKVFFGKESEKASEEKPVEKLSREKPSEQPKPKPKPKLVRFHCGYCGRDGHKDEFCFKRKREERMAKEWAKYHPSNGVFEHRVQMPRAKASEDSSGLGRAKGCWRCCKPGYTGQTGEGHRSDRCRPGHAAV